MANVCASPVTTYIQNTAWGSAACVPTPANYYTRVNYLSLSNANGVTSLCNRNCNADSQRCKAYVANAVYDVAVTNWAVACYLMTTQAPSPTKCPSIPKRADSDSPSIDALIQGLQNVDVALTDTANAVASIGSDPVGAVSNIVTGLVDIATAVAAVPTPAVGSLTDLPSADQDTLCALDEQVNDSVTNLVATLQSLLNLPLVGSTLRPALSTANNAVNGLLGSLLAAGLDCSLVSVSLTSPTLIMTSPTIPSPTITLASPTVSVPASPSLSLSSPTISTPVVSTPVVSTPEVSTPEVSTPEVSTPEVSTPEVSTPEVSTPAVSTPTISTPTSVTSFPNVIYAAYRDDIRSCFSQSLTSAVRYCSSLLGKPPPSTKVSYTAKITPTTTKTTTKFSTTSLCSIKRGPGARGPADDFPEPTPDSALQEDIKRYPVPFGVVPRATPAPAPAPACLQPKVYPGWNSVSACRCLSSVTALTVKTISTAAPVTKLVTKVTTKSVQKPSIPTFQPRAFFAGPASSGGGTFNIISKVTKDSKGINKKILQYSRPNAGQAGQMAMHISTPQTSPSSPNKLFGVAPDQKNAIKFYGQLAFATLSNGVNVIGEMPAGQGFNSCTVPERVANAKVTCKLASGNPAVFYEVPIPGQRGRYAIGVADKAAPKGAKVLTLQAAGWGTVIVGCGK